MRKKTTAYEDDELFSEKLPTPRRRRSKSNSKPQNLYLKETEEENTLVGKCLVYIGQDGNDTYNQAVIYITHCSPERVKGIMINKLLFGSAVVECHSKEDGIEKEARGVYEDLYQGGPVNPANGFVLFPYLLLACKSCFRCVCYLPDCSAKLHFLPPAEIWPQNKNSSWLFLRYISGWCLCFQPCFSTFCNFAMKKESRPPKFWSISARVAIQPSLFIRG